MLYFTYLPQTDGLGGQYQRIIGIVALAKHYDAEYVHTPITEMEHIDDKKYIQTIEDYFQINQHWKPTTHYNYQHTHTMSEVDETTLLQWKQQSQQKNENILVKIFLPRRIIDRKPELYSTILLKLKSIKQQLLLPYYHPNKKNIAIHIRRGDVSQTENAFRYTSIDYFHNVVQYFLKNEANSNPNANICIFTEITKENNTEFDAFQNYENTKVIANADVITTMDHLIHADVLVMCKSSFSYIAGMYNNNKVIYADNFWHPPLLHWYSPMGEWYI